MVMNLISWKLKKHQPKRERDLLSMINFLGGNITSKTSKNDVIHTGMKRLPQPLTGEQELGKMERKRNHIQQGCLGGSDKPCPHQEDTMTRKHVECQPCQKTEALMKSVDAEEKSSLKISDFPRLHEEYKKSDDSSVPAFLYYVEKGIGHDIAAGSIFGDDILDLARALFYAAIDEMHNMKLEGINEDVMRKWGCVFRDCKKMDLDVEFTEEHLKKIVHAYFVSLLEEEEEELLELNVVCSMSDTESFDDGAPLSKGILSSAPMEPTRAPI